MNLLQIRQKFRELSGRFDLVNSDGSDNGADFFINEGRKFLDRMDETQKSAASHYQLLGSGEFGFSIPYCRGIKEVWIADLTHNRWQLHKMDLQEMIMGYLTGLPSTRTAGTPLYYAPCISRYSPGSAEAGDLGAFAGFIENPAGTSEHYNTILLNATVQYQSMMDVRGLFYSPELVNDTDANYWSEVHPMMLYMSAMRQIEIVNRNTQGVNDWTNAIAVEMKQLGMDMVEEVISECDQMGRVVV